MITVGNWGHVTPHIDWGQGKLARAFGTSAERG
jgi:hypothetical protein